MITLIRRVDFYYKEFLLKNIGLKRVIFWFVLTYVIYGFLLFFIIPDLMTYTGGKPIFNIMPFGYTEEYVRNLLESMGEKGRHMYLYWLIPVDLFFPFMFAYCNLILTGYLLNRLGSMRGDFIYLCLLPVFASWFDYLENLGVWFMLVKYPDVSDNTIQFSNFFSVAKCMLITIYFAVLVVIFFLIWKRKKSLFGPATGNS